MIPILNPRLNRKMVPVAPWLLLALAISACEPSFDDHIDKLGKGGEAAEEAKNDLILAKELPIDPLLTALIDPERTAARAEIVDVLARLMTMTENERILPALIQRLRDDPDPLVRARVIERTSERHGADMLDDLFVALEDEGDDVRFQAVLALSQLREGLNPVQDGSLRLQVRRLAQDNHEETRLHALYLVGHYVSEWVDEAGRVALRGETAKAESLLHSALDYHPESKKARYRLGRHYFDFGQQERGLQVLRDNSMLVDVPRLTESPTIDGRLDDVVWQRPAPIDTLWVHVIDDDVLVTFPSRNRTQVYFGYTSDAVYMAAYCHEPNPEELVTEGYWGDYPRQDQAEFVVDGSFDHNTFGSIIITGGATIAEGWWKRTPVTSFDASWEPEVEGASFVGEDFWSVECRIPYGQQGFPQAKPGDLWGFNFVRVWRGRDYSQWVVDFRDGTWHADKFGFLRFE